MTAAPYVATDAGLWIAKYNLQSYLQTVGLSLQASLKDSTVMGPSTTYMARVGALKSAGVQVSGLWDTTAVVPDDAEFNAILGTSCPVTVSNTTTVGAVAYIFLGLGGDYQPGATVGDLFAFTAGTQGTSIVARGLLMENTTRIVTANGTGQQLGALSASQSMYCNLHVPTVSGSSPTLDVTVQSAAASNFSGATTRATFSQLGAAGSAQKIIAGAVTDTWWRFVLTIGGSSPSFAIAGSMGIAP